MANSHNWLEVSLQREGMVTIPDTALTPNDQIPLCPTGATKLVPTGACATDPPCRIRANLSVPMGGGIFRSWLALPPPFGWPSVGGAEVAERGEDDPEETDGIGESPGGKIFLYCFITYKKLGLWETLLERSSLQYSCVKIFSFYKFIQIKLQNFCKHSRLVLLIISISK